MSKDGISFFSESDMVIRKDGKKVISAEYPSWYNAQVVDEIQEEISRDEYNLKMGYIKESQMPVVRKRLDELKTKLESIEESIPKLSDKQKDTLKSTLKGLGNEIRDRMFTRSQMMKGLADTHEEANRMIKPSISVTPEVAELAKACNVPITDGKISRDQASKIWKIGMRSLDEMSDTEVLRKD